MKKDNSSEEIYRKTTADKLSAICCILCAISLAIGILTLSAEISSAVKAESHSFANVSEEEGFPYKAYVSGGRIIIEDIGGHTVYVFEAPFESLPEADKMMLYEGITLATKEEYIALTEDYES